MIASRKVKVDYFDKIPNGFTLNRDGKAALLTAFNSFMDKSIRYRGRNIKRSNIIQFDCHRIANELIK
jgi:CRISPR-associated protein Cas1